MCDLYRIGAPALYKLRARFQFPPEQSGFLRGLQRTLYEHAKSHALITAEALKHGVRILADSWMPSVVYDSSRIMLYCAMHLVDPATDEGKSFLAQTVPHLQSNIKALRKMRSLFTIAEPLVRHRSRNAAYCKVLANPMVRSQCATAETMLERVLVGSEMLERGIIPDDPCSPSPNDMNR